MIKGPSDFADLIGPALAGALEKKGYTSLTPVQETILDPALQGRDLRITSQTGSGKTVAIGFALRALVEAGVGAQRGKARPRAIVVAPTRELAKQVEEELGWLYAPLGAKVASATGGSRIRDEHRALAAGPAVVAGTPGRLLDHLKRGAIDASEVGAIVLDEADRMLDLGFRDELEAILGFAPPGHRTHLVSATFPREVRALADRVQENAAHVEGTRLGAANADIDHVMHLVDARDRVGAIVNLLLANPDEQTLVFARTRADVAQIARELGQAGFSVSSISGEMEQDERNRALSGFKRNILRVLVATDVAARGIDVQDIGRVIHAESPNDADTYTHRSGRTGRAGRKGTSSVLVTPAGMNQAHRIMSRAGVPHRFEAVPTAASIRAVRDEQFFAELTAADTDGKSTPTDERTTALAARLVEAGELPRTLARLLARARTASGTEPRDVRPIEPPTDRGKRTTRERPRPERAHRDEPRAYREEPRAHRDSARPQYDEPRGPREETRGQDGPRVRRDERGGVFFDVTWGEVHGADVRRLLAVVCRRGGIQGSDVGAIRVGRTSSVVEIAQSVAEAFAEAAARPDPRDPKILIRAESSRSERADSSGPERAESSPPERPASSRPERVESSRPERVASSRPEAPAKAERRPAAPARERPHASPPAPHSSHAPPARKGRAKPGDNAEIHTKRSFTATKRKLWEAVKGSSPQPRGRGTTKAGDAPPKRSRTH